MRAPLVALAAAIGLATAPLSSSAQGQQTEPIVLGQIGLSFYAVVGGLVEELLEAEGHLVEVVEAGHAEIFPQLGAGDVDILAAAWLPAGHSSLYEPVEDQTFRIAPIYEDARFFWVVPSYVPETEVASIGDLTKPDVRDRMPDRIVSLPEATGLTVGARRVMDAYGLHEAGYQLVAAPPADWLGAFQDALEKEEWVVFPLWQPQWVNAAYDIRALEEPEGAYGPPDTAWLIGHVSLREKLPEDSLKLLSNIRLDVSDVTEMDRLVNVEGLDSRAAANRWMAQNPDAVNAWRGE